MKKRSLVFLLISAWVLSASMLAPVVTPYFTIEPTLTKPDSYTPTKVYEYTQNFKARTKRNIKRLKTAQKFAPYFVLSFATFTTSSLCLCFLAILFFIRRYRLITNRK